MRLCCGRRKPQFLSQVAVGRAPISRTRKEVQEGILSRASHRQSPQLLPCHQHSNRRAEHCQGRNPADYSQVTRNHELAHYRPAGSHMQDYGH